VRTKAAINRLRKLFEAETAGGILNKFFESLLAIGNFVIALKKTKLEGKGITSDKAIITLDSGLLRAGQIQISKPP